MDIIISDKWLREFLETKATPKQIAEYVSLCGPSIERLEEKDGDTLYHVEITTNRIDCTGVYGFAREVSAILPRFGLSAKLKPFSPNNKIKRIEDLPFNIVGNSKLVRRSMGVVLTNIKNWKTPSWMEKRLNNCGIRSLNAVVDITNYVMLETGHPSHAFDYDKIKNKKFVIRESKKGEKVTSFDGKTYTLTGGDIVFDDGDGEIIDLPGIIGTKNSVVGANTKRVFFFVDNNDPSHIRKSSMTHSIRTMAATINEKDVDPELSKIAIYRGIELFSNVCKAKIASKIYDEYDAPYKTKSIEIYKKYIDSKLGVTISKEEIENYLKSLYFQPKWKQDKLTVFVPSFRANDINIPEDVIEEIARIYGYHNLPSTLMSGSLPDPLYESPFDLEWRVKNILKALGGSETYTLSLVPDEYVANTSSLKLKNPLGSDSEYLRTSLSNSLIDAINKNIGNYETLFLFEMANVYIPKNGSLPEERFTLGMGFDGYKFADVKGVVGTMLQKELKISFEIAKTEESGKFEITANKETIGYIKLSDDGIIISEINMNYLVKYAGEYGSYKQIPKHPPQIEDLTVKIPDGVEVGKVLREIKSASKFISEVELRDVYKNSYTFRVSYQDPEKTMTDSEVQKVRTEIFGILKDKFNLEITK